MTFFISIMQIKKIARQINRTNYLLTATHSFHNNILHPIAHFVNKNWTFLIYLSQIFCSFLYNKYNYFCSNSYKKIPVNFHKYFLHYGAGERSRTSNLLITSQLLCHWATGADRRDYWPGVAVWASPIIYYTLC